MEKQCSLIHGTWETKKRGKWGDQGVHVSFRDMLSDLPHFCKILPNVSTRNQRIQVLMKRNILLCLNFPQNVNDTQEINHVSSHLVPKTLSKHFLWSQGVTCNRKKVS